MPPADPNGIAKRFAHEGARVHFPKCRHRPDPAAWSGDLCEEPVTFRGDRHDARLTMPQGDHEGPQRAANGLVCLLLPDTRRRPSRYESPLARAFSEMQAPTGPGGLERGPLRGTGDFSRRWRQLLWHLLSASRRMRRSTAGYDPYSSFVASLAPSTSASRSFTG